MPRDLKDIAPCDALEVYPLMFGGVVGATLVPELVKVSPERALTMLIFSFCMQGEYSNVDRCSRLTGVRTWVLHWRSQAFCLDGARHDAAYR
jgi:hypothetical protein